MIPVRDGVSGKRLLSINNGVSHSVMVDAESLPIITVNGDSMLNF